MDPSSNIPFEAIDPAKKKEVNVDSDLLNVISIEKDYPVREVFAAIEAKILTMGITIDEAVICCYGDTETGKYEVNIEGVRLETDAEYLERIKLVEERRSTMRKYADAHQKRLEDEEYATYLKLKEKYEHK